MTDNPNVRAGSFAFAEADRLFRAQTRTSGGGNRKSWVLACEGFSRLVAVVLVTTASPTSRYC